jgi:hypothetical protein
VAPCSRNELERFSHDGLEALLMKVQDDYHLREGEDQLYLDATKPIGALLRKRRRENVGPSLPATQVVKSRALSPIADYATADYAAVMDGGNLKDVEVLKELVHKSVVPARHYVNTKIFGECLNQVRRMEAAIVFGPIHVQGSGVGEADVDHLVSRYRFFGLPRFTGLPAKMKEELPAYRAAVTMIKPLE